MPKGVPTSGKRKLYAKWSYETLRPLYLRWQAGETLQAVATSVNTSQGRLRWAMDYYGLKAPPRSFGRTQPTPRFDATIHRSARHYKGTFEL